MSEQAVKEYLAHHPNAVEDKEKARLMADASRTYEEDVVDIGSRALDLAAHQSEGGRHQRAVQMDNELREAQAARANADRAASRAAEVYDTVKSL